jgi:hypothetical protein
METSKTRRPNSIKIIKCNRSLLRRRLLVNLVRQHPQMRSYFASGGRDKMESLFEAGLEIVLEHLDDLTLAEKLLADIVRDLPPLDFPPSVRLALPTLLLTTIAETFGPPQA